jgi:hypothetical protein
VGINKKILPKEKKHGTKPTKKHETEKWRT